jgi:hypothetical protein
MLALCAASLLLAGTASAQTTVYGQAPNGGGFAGSYVLNDPNDPGFNWVVDTDTERWEYFIAPTTASFNRIVWYGNNADGQFAVDLFTATCFSCNASPVGGGGTFAHTSINPGNGPTLLPNVGPYSQAQVHKTLVSGSANTALYAYSIDLTSPVTLTAGGGYGISVVNNYSSAPFAWATATGNSNSHLVYTMTYAAYQFLPSPGDLAFSLIDTTAVPEPASAWTFGAGLLALIGWKRRAGGRLLAAGWSAGQGPLSA